MDRDSTFDDVAPGSYYYDAVQWAVAQGITVGTGRNTFSPNAVCNRAQAVTIFYRYEQSPAVSGGNAFTDVASGAYYANAVQWAVDKGVTVGTSSTTFSPNATCTRGQIVTFLYEGMQDLSLNSKTVRGLHALIRQCLDQAVQERLIPYNPAVGCRLPQKEKKEMQVIPPEKIGAYLRAAEEYGVLPMFYLELTTGLRRGELTALLWNDLDVKRQTLSVSKSAGRINGEVKVTQPKTKNSVRTIHLPKETVDLLAEEHRKHIFNPYMFPSPVTGAMYAPECVGRLHQKRLEKTGITEKVRFHDLRHTFATLAIQGGVDVKTVSSILGHYSAGFTLDTYTHVTGDMQKEAAKRVGSIISQAV